MSIGAHHIIALRKGPVKANMKNDSSVTVIMSTQKDFDCLSLSLSFKEDGDLISCQRNSSFPAIKKENIAHKP